MDFVRRPEDFDVVVASNLFGDILTDIGAIITGSMGLAPSGNIDPQRRFPSMFEPVHGSAPDIMGKGIANPLAAIISGSMMLRFIGEVEASETIDAAVLKVVEAGKILPPTSVVKPQPHRSVCCRERARLMCFVMFQYEMGIW